jgi:L-gulonate 5-dehydrogenase
MRAAIMNAPFDLAIGTVDTPRPGPGEALVSVGAAGICAGDMYIYQGKNPYSRYPQVAGHEIAGTVAEVGPGVTAIEPGARVAVEPFIGCGSCYPCRVAKPNCCARLSIIGVHRPGGYADFVVAPARNLHRVPGGMSLLEASFAEPVAIGVQSCRRGGVGAEDVLVLGCGPIGLAIIEVARARGARVTAADVLPARLETARRFGAETIPADGKLLEEVLSRTNGEGMPVVMEATGNPEAMEATADLVAAGGRIVIIGLVKQGIRVSFAGLDFTRKEMTIVGSRASAGCFPEALSLLASGAVTYPRVATEFSLWDAPAVFARLDREPGSVQKGVLVRESAE